MGHSSGPNGARVRRGAKGDADFSIGSGAAECGAATGGTEAALDEETECAGAEAEEEREATEETDSVAASGAGEETDCGPPVEEGFDSAVTLEVSSPAGSAPPHDGQKRLRGVTAIWQIGQTRGMELIRQVAYQMPSVFPEAYAAVMKFSWRLARRLPIKKHND